MSRITDSVIIFKMHDITAAANASPSSTDGQEFNQMIQLVFENDIKRWGTLEKDQFILDGEHQAFPDDPTTEIFPFWSDRLSDDEGAFASPPQLQLTFKDSQDVRTAHDSVGISLIFDELDGDYCSSVNIKWYSTTDVLLSDKNFAPDKPLYFCDNKVAGFSRVVITFNSTSKPYRYVKLNRIDIGLTYPIGGENLIEAEVLEEVDSMSRELRVSTLDLTMFDQNDNFNLINPGGYYEFLQRGQVVHPYGYINGEKIYFGAYYFDTLRQSSERVVNMQCQNAIGLLSQMPFDGGMYKNALVSTMLSEIQIATQNRISIILDPSLASKTVSGWLPITSCREALQEIAFAIGAMVVTDRSDSVYLRPAPTVTAGVIPDGRTIDDQRASQEPLVTAVEVTAHGYAGNLYENNLIEEELPVGEHRIEFGKPNHGLEVTGATITKEHVNYAILNVATAGQVTLTGKEYRHGSIAYKKELDNIPVGQPANVLRFDSTLISEDIGEAVAQRELERCQNRLINSGAIFLTAAERPGQKIDIKSTGGHMVRGHIESLRTDLTGGMIADVKIRGKAAL